MSKKLLISVVIIALLAVGSALGTYAWFTSQATSTGNVFQTGTLDISGPGKIATNLNVGGIFPSWSDTKTVTVTNSGTLPFRYRLSVLPLVGNLLYDGPTPLQVKVNNGNFVNINQLGVVDLATLAPNASANLTFDFKLPSEADNAYQGKYADFTFVFDAIQTQAAEYNGVVAQDFGYAEWSGVAGYNVGFRLVGLKAKDLESVEVSLYNNGTLLATNTSKNVLANYPGATQLSTPFDIDGSYTDNEWNYGAWLVGHQGDAANKAVIKVTTKDHMVYTAVNNNCSPARPAIVQQNNN